MKTVRVSAGVLLRADRRFLLAQRPEGKAFGGYWEFPGGKIEAGETEYDALKRELREELGIDVQAATPWRVEYVTYPHAAIELHFFHVTAWEGNPTGLEGQVVVWEQLPLTVAEPLLPANRAILSALNDLEVR